MSEIPQIEAGDTVRMDLKSTSGNELEAEAEVLGARNDADGFEGKIDLNGSTVRLTLSQTVSELQMAEGIGSVKSGGSKLGSVLGIEVC